MIDKVVIVPSVIYLLVLGTSSFPTNSGPSSSKPDNTSDSLTFASTTVFPLPDSTSVEVNESDPSPEHSSLDQEQLQSYKASPKIRKNKKDADYCCPEDDLEEVTESSRRNRDRERNTKPPVVRRGRDPEEEFEEPTFERRPALLLRFFPDGTAVLISKFQLHLHVKPKQAKFVPEDKEEHYPVDLKPGFFLENDKSYEVSYKRLEALPWAKEQNVFDLDESEENEAYNVHPQDHEFVTPSSSSGANKPASERKLYSLQESPTTTLLNEEQQTTDTPVGNNNQKSYTTVGDSSWKADEQVSSTQQQHDPVRAEHLKVTTVSVSDPNVTADEGRTTQIPPSSTDTVVTTTQTPAPTTEPVTATAEPAITTPKCPSFKNQLSLALSTEDNIGNSLLKKNILPTEDCNSSDSEDFNAIAKLQNAETTTTRQALTTLPITARPKSEPTTASYTRNHLVPYLASQFSNDPSKPDVVVVTSLPVLIDLKSNRNQPATDVPAWREVTVGVVRDQQGQPMKPRYNNWVAHMRTLRKKTDNKFWNDLTTPRPSFRPDSRQPIQQPFQQAPSQVNRAFWADLQRQRPLTDQRGRGNANPQTYRSDPPRHYPVPSRDEYQFWRHGMQGNRWNSNNAPEYERKGPLRNAQQDFENNERHSNQQWSRGNTLKNHRRW